MFKINSKINFVRILSGLIIVLGFILVIMAITAKVASQNKPVITSSPSIAASPAITAEITKNNGVLYIIDAGNGKKVYDGIFLLEDNGNNVFSVLKKLSEADKAFDIVYSNDARYGIFVESIGGIKNGTDGKYWQYYINGALGDVAADKKEVKAGDKVEWKLETVPEM